LIEQLPLAKNSQETFVKLALLVDQIAELNDSKNRSITSNTVILSFSSREVDHTINLLKQ
jgi:hypothetical protein